MKNKITCYVLVLSVLVFSIITYFAVDHVQGDKAIKTTECIAYIINVKYVNKLTCTDKDIGVYEYERLKLQLKALPEIGGGYYACLLLKRGNDILIGVDSENIGEKDYSPPGDSYYDAPQGIKDIFEKPCVTRVGPYKDRWGTWVSILVPIKDETGKTIAVLENDISAYVWILNNVGFSSLIITIYALFIYLVRLLIKAKRTNKELVDAKKNADIANEAKGNFLANMSHEIRTPLNGIVGAIQILSTTKVTDEQEKFITMALYCSESLLNLINDILDYSKLEARKIILNNEQFDLIDIIDQTLDMERVIAKERNIEIRYQSKMLLPELVGDSLRLKQILANLLNNAIKFSHNNGVVVLSSMIENETNKDMTIKFSITDHGIGIDEEHISKLFNRFYQIQGGLTRNYGGAGLGLSICKQLVDLMGGEIGVISKRNLGSTFWFTLTLKKPTEVTVKKNNGIKLKSNTLEETKILIVEDVQMNKKIIEAMLTKNNYKVNSVDNGKQALDELMVNKYTIILMDMQMPIMDGITATQEIRKGNGPNKQTPIIALTANAIGDVKNTCLVAGMNDYLSKPVTLPALLAMIEKWEEANGIIETNI